MKRYQLFMLGLLSLTFSACNNDEKTSIPVNESNKTLIVSLSGIGSTTRATTPGDAWIKDEDGETAKGNLNSLGLLFTDANGKILYTYNLEKTNTEHWNGLFLKGVKFIGLKDVTAVYAVANKRHSLTAGDNVSTLSTQLQDQGISVPITKTDVCYVGADKKITPVEPEPSAEMPEVELEGNAGDANFYYTAELKLKPVISRIQINSIKVLSSGSTTFGPEDNSAKYTLKWEGFTPELQGIYLNNFAPKFNDLTGSVTDLLKNTLAAGSITEGKWLFGQADYAANAAYIKYENGYSALLNTGTENNGKTSYTIGEKKCVAFNIFVPFGIEDITPAQWESANNPTIHFQFNNNVADYKKEVVLTATGGAVTSEEDKAEVATATEYINYILPETNGSLFANINKLYKEENLSAELQLQAGYIYNMDVEISPANMTVDLSTPKSYNVVVEITVLPFNDMNIYPGFE